MALTRDQIDDLAEEGVFLGNVYEIAQAIEAEVRKEDTELIRQLVDALEKIDAAMPFPVAKKAIAAGRARLEDKSCPKE